MINSFIFACRGLRNTWREEINFRIEVLVMLCLSFFIFYFKFSLAETAFCLVAVTMVLSAEIINTAIEDLCNKIEPNHDPVIGKIKDTASAFVLVSTLGSIAVGCIVFYNHFFIIN